MRDEERKRRIDSMLESYGGDMQAAILNILDLEEEKESLKRIADLAALRVELVVHQNALEYGQRIAVLTAQLAASRSAALEEAAALLDEEVRRHRADNPPHELLEEFAKKIRELAALRSPVVEQKIGEAIIRRPLFGGDGRLTMLVCDALGLTWPDGFKEGDRVVVKIVRAATEEP